MQLLRRRASCGRKAGGQRSPITDLTCYALANMARRLRTDARLQVVLILVLATRLPCRNFVTDDCPLSTLLVAQLFLTKTPQMAFLPAISGSILKSPK
jgi:hypothetical protein